MCRYKRQQVAEIEWNIHILIKPSMEFLMIWILTVCCREMRLVRMCDKFGVWNSEFSNSEWGELSGKSVTKGSLIIHKAFLWGQSDRAVGSVLTLYVWTPLWPLTPHMSTEHTGKRKSLSIVGCGSKTNKKIYSLPPDKIMWSSGLPHSTLHLPLL